MPPANANRQIRTVLVICIGPRCPVGPVEFGIGSHVFSLPMNLETAEVRRNTTMDQFTTLFQRLLANRSPSTSLSCNKSGRKMKAGGSINPARTCTLRLMTHSLGLASCGSEVCRLLAARDRNQQAEGYSD